MIKYDHKHWTVVRNCKFFQNSLHIKLLMKYSVTVKKNIYQPEMLILNLKRFNYNNLQIFLQESECLYIL